MIALPTPPTSHSGPTQSSALSLLSMLQEDSQPLVFSALKKLLRVVDTLWHEVSASLPLLEEIAEGEEFPKETKAVASAVASRVFFHLEEYRDSLRLALGAGDAYFNVVSDKSPYVETLVCKAIEIYTKVSDSSSVADDDVMDDNVEDDGLKDKVLGIVEKMFERCYSERTWSHALGIALEAKNIDKVKQILEKCGDSLNEKVATLQYGLSACTTVVVNRAFRTEALTVIGENFRSLPESHNDFASLVRCEHLLGNSSSVSEMLAGLLKTGGDKSLLALQLCFDLVDTGDQHFVSAVTSGLPKGDSVSSEIKADMEKVTAILEGGFAGELELAFLFKESDSDPLIIANLKKSLEEKGKVASLLHSMSLHANAFLNAGTTNDKFLRENLEYLKKANNWAKFSATANLGCIHQGHVTEAMTLLEPYLPAEGGAVAATGGYAEGGALMALGLIHGKPNCATALRTSTTRYLRDQLRTNSANETICHGAALGVGLSGLGCRDATIFNELKEVLYTDSAVAGEAAGIAMGMVQLGNGGGGNQEVTEMLAYAKDTSHEKIIRGLSLGIALMHYQLEEKADGIIEQLFRDRDPVLRYGGMWTVALAYVGTGNNAAIKKLLHVAISDVSNEVRMAAITALAFVLFKTPERVPELVKLLLVSFNPHVRYASCMAVGIAMAGSGNADTLAILEPMLEDLTDFVRQGALIATSMVMMQAPESHKSYKKFKSKLTGIVGEKHQSPLTKMGAILGQGIMDAGGRNVCLNMASRDGFVKPTSVIGIMMFCQHWFWHPCCSLLGLAFQPTVMAGLNHDLAFVKKFVVTCNSKPSAFAYPARLVEKKEEVKKRVTTVSLSTTAKAKAAAAKKKKEEGGDDMEVDKKEEETKKEGEGEGEEEKEGEEDSEAAKKKKKKGPEPKSFELNNPSRMTKSQVRVCEPKPGRYHPVLAGAKSGIILLTDTTPTEEDDEVEKVTVPSVEEEEAKMPEPFVWRPEGAAPAAAPTTTDTTATTPTTTTDDRAAK
ncbi:hypothetical protein TrVE_jg10477 [Triparma verrucosa]|uniref:26S proteasome non-ATPase regulatory subunit 1 homolog n=1 Tax=Triparma verrucosa TaxID=1606542 RepID=A0A9W7FAS7_9STRA|nr:hypothetical protein TrVE_jg10477 [Triparma verrucosa]